MVPLVGQVRVAAWNVTGGWVDGNATLVPQIRNNAIDGLYIQNYNCTNSRRCTYIVELYCSTFYSDYCRFDLLALPWSTVDVANTTLILQNSVPQLGFSGSDMGQGLTRTHYEFHVPQDSFSNITITTTAIEGYHWIAASRSRYPMMDPRTRRPFPEPDLPWDDFNEARIPGPNKAIYFDWTNAVFAANESSGSPKYSSMAGAYYVTVFSNATYGPAVYTITLDTHDNSTRGYNNNRSAIFLADGLTQHGYLAPETTHQLFAFVAPYVNTSRGLAPRTVEFILQTEDENTSNFPAAYITWDGTVPWANNSQYNLTWRSQVPGTDYSLRSVFILPGQAGSCDTTKQDCVYMITVTKPQVPGGARPVTESSFKLTASAGASYLPLTNGRREVGSVSPGGEFGFIVDVTRDPFSPFPQDLTVILQPNRLFCDLVAFVEYQRDPTFASPSTNNTQGVRILRIRNPQSGRYTINVVAPRWNDDVCQFTILATDRPIELEDGVPQADLLSYDDNRQPDNSSWAVYHFDRPGRQQQPVYFQVDRLSPNSLINVYVKYDHNPAGPWLWSAMWNSSAELVDTVVANFTDPQWNSTARGFFVAVQCLRRDWAGGDSACCVHRHSGQCQCSTPAH